MSIVSWSRIASQYTDTIILGNGASISLANSFAYSSLYNAAVSRGHLDNAHQDIFSFFKTQDFEFVLRALSHANAINAHLRVAETETLAAYQHIRDSLIRTVKQVHPDHSKVEGQFDGMTNCLKQFKTIFSLNYDLTLYWSMLNYNETVGGNYFKDCFRADSSFMSDYDFLRKPHKHLQSSALVFFPHGNLVLATDMWGVESKVIIQKSDLLNSITDAWTISGVNPLFVSEGDSQKKLRSIRRNAYLNQVYTELSKPRRSLAIYGWGLSQQDGHILDALGKGGISQIAVSVFTKGGDPNDFCYQAQRAIKQVHGLRSAKIDFFDACESGVWVNP